MGIAELMPRYLEARAPGGTEYEVVRSMPVDGHEVAWMEYRGTVKVDITGGGRTGEPYSGRQLMCECDFREGVGWRVDEKHGVVGLTNDHDASHCLARAAARHLRHLELRREYRERFLEGGFDSLRGHLGEVIEDLKEKVRAGEFIGEDGGGAKFWGGYFYLQTLAEITDEYVGHLWAPVRALWAERKLMLEGAVVQDYSEPPPPEWVEHARLEDGGWVGVASLPGHRQMAHEWHFDVYRPDGSAAYSLVPGLPLVHERLFGPDVEDVDRARARLAELVADARGRSSG